MSDLLEAIETWGRTNGGTAGDIRRQCPQLKKKTLKQISALCDQLVAEGRLLAARVPVPNNRYVGRSLEKSSEYTQAASISDAVIG